MLRRVASLLILLCLFTLSARSQQATPLTRQPRILLLVDGSSSMLQPWYGNEIRFKAAGRIVESLMDSIYAVNPNVEFGLRVYGHQSPAQNKDCYDSRLEVMFSKNNITQMGLRLASLRPYGVSPIAYSLKQAADFDLVDDAKNAYAIILITDGGESCGGNICDVVKELIERKIYFRPYILSLVDYAPLRDQYACLGSYLQIGKPGEIAPAVNRIVDAYRPILSMPIPVGSMPVAKPPTTRVDTAAVPVPKIVIPVPELRKAETTANLRPSGLRMLEIPGRSYFRIAPRRLTVQRIDIAKLFPPEPRVVDNLSTIGTRRPDADGVPTRKPDPKPNPRVIAVPNPGDLGIRPEPRVADNLPELRARTIRSRASWRISGDGVPPIALPVPNRGPFVVRIDDPEPKPPTVVTRPVDTARPKPPVVVKVDTPKRPVIVKVDTPKPPVVVMTPIKTTPVKPVPVTRPKPTPAAITGISTEDAPETELSIYFTDGHGKFYTTSPQLRLEDATTGKTVKQFHRTVDPSGNPDPQKITAGTYNIIATARPNLVLKKVVLVEKKNNKIIVKVSNGSLSFYYRDNPNRPVTEFNAIVNIRFEDGPINQKQRCSEELEYAPGNYHVEISTLPVMQTNSDIDFGQVTAIGIPEPGFVQFTNTNNVGTAHLYHPLGDRFMRFYSLRVTGVRETQRVQLLPGAYEVHWVTNPNTPRAKQETLRFMIRSNMETSIELN